MQIHSRAHLIKFNSAYRIILYQTRYVFNLQMLKFVVLWLSRERSSARIMLLSILCNAVQFNRSWVWIWSDSIDWYSESVIPSFDTWSLSVRATRLGFHVRDYVNGMKRPICPRSFMQLFKANCCLNRTASNWLICSCYCTMAILQS